MWNDVRKSSDQVKLNRQGLFQLFQRITRCQQRVTNASRVITADILGDGFDSFADLLQRADVKGSVSDQDAEVLSRAAADADRSLTLANLQAATLFSSLPTVQEIADGVDV